AKREIDDPDPVLRLQGDSFVDRGDDRRIRALPVGVERLQINDVGCRRNSAKGVIETVSRRLETVAGYNARYVSPVPEGVVGAGIARDEAFRVNDSRVQIGMIVDAAVDYRYSHVGPVPAILERNVGVHGGFGKLEGAAHLPVRRDVFNGRVIGQGTGRGRRYR